MYTKPALCKTGAIDDEAAQAIATGGDKYTMGLVAARVAQVLLALILALVLTPVTSKTPHQSDIVMMPPEDRWHIKSTWDQGSWSGSVYPNCTATSELGAKGSCDGGAVIFKGPVKCHGRELSEASVMYGRAVACV